MAVRFEGLGIFSSDAVTKDDVIYLFIAVRFEGLGDI